MNYNKKRVQTEVVISRRNIHLADHHMVVMQMKMM
jgi:hypothetical protein